MLRKTAKRATKNKGDGEVGLALGKGAKVDSREQRKDASQHAHSSVECGRLPGGPGALQRTCWLGQASQKSTWPAIPTGSLAEGPRAPSTQAALMHAPRADAKRKREIWAVFWPLGTRLGWDDTCSKGKVCV